MTLETTENPLGFPMDDEVIDPMMTGEYTKLDDYARVLGDILVEANPLKLKPGCPYDKEAQEIIKQIFENEESNDRAWKYAFGFGLKMPASINHKINLLRAGRKRKLLEDGDV